MRSILLVEDDRALGESLTERLKRDYHTVWARSVGEFKEISSRENFDLAILDVGLPDGDGFEIASTLSRTQCQFMFLTARSEAESRLKGFELGAVDFVPKPFFLKELLLRVQRLLKSTETTPAVIRLSSCEINWEEGSIVNQGGGREYPSVSDMKILRLLIESSPAVVPRDEIINKVWGPDSNPNLRSIDNAMVRLRGLLGNEGQQIRSVRGVGYQWLQGDKHE